MTRTTTLAKISGALMMLTVVGGCVSTPGESYGGGAPFAPYSSGYGMPAASLGGYGGGREASGCGMGYGPVQGCGASQPQRQGPGVFSKRNMGALGGAAAGGWAGSQIGNGTGQLAATAVGVLLGALTGGSVGDSMDKTDEAYAYMQLQQSLNANQPVLWQGKQATGLITPIRTVPKKKKSDQTCREFRHEVMIGDQKKEGVGRACLQKDGSWKLANG